MQFLTRIAPCTLLGMAVLLAVPVGVCARDVTQEQMDLPVSVTNGYGKVITHTLQVTVWRNSANPQPSPILVLNHGRPAEPQGRAELGRAQFPAAADFFLRRGFIVAVPTRIGYGVTGGEDLENSGACDHKNYPPAFAAAAQQTLAVIEAMRQRPDTVKDHTVVVGQSFGGAAAVAVAALNPSGVQAVINFAGGGGGNPKTMPQRPCAPHLLEKMFQDFGRTARVPSLWVYTENDMYFGPHYPRDWFGAYVAAGGRAQWVQFSPQGVDGHSLFTRFPRVWQPAVGEFLDTQGFKPTTGDD